MTIWEKDRSVNSAYHRITDVSSLQCQSFVFGKERPSWDAANSPILFDLHLRRILQELGLAFSLLFGILILFSYSIQYEEKCG